MKELRGDIWQSFADVICVTTNGIVKENGNAVMGRGIAFEASTIYPPLPKYLGHCLKTFGNHVFVFPLTNKILSWDPIIVTFPTKQDWRLNSTIALILQSASELAVMAHANPKWKRIAIPKPGCGNGGLNWDHDVKHVLEAIFQDDKFEIWSR